MCYPILMLKQQEKQMKSLKLHDTILADGYKATVYSSAKIVSCSFNDFICFPVTIGVKNKYGQTTVSFDTVDKYVEINSHPVYHSNDCWVAISIMNLENSKREYYVEINIKCEEDVRTVFYTALKHYYYYECVIVDNEIFANILK